MSGSAGSARLGEFGRIARFFAPLAGPGGLGLTDDAALVDCPPGHRLVMTVDAMVEGVHYLASDPPDLVARKLLRVNLSDLAAMGARPKHYLLTTALPQSFGDDWLAAFASGLAEDQRLFGIDLLGGDSVSTPGPATLSLTAIGEVATGAEIRRGGAKPGDDVWVSGTIGDAYLGLKVLRGEYPDLSPDDRAYLAGRYRLPAPRTGLGARLIGLAHAMQDVSDGLLADLGHICDVSGVGATVSLPEIPLSAAAARITAVAPQIAAQFATGGDDYELLFTAPRDKAGSIKAAAKESCVQISRIGTVEAGTTVRLVDRAGKAIEVGPAGYRHF